MSEDRKIIQIIPSGGWKAAYAQDGKPFFSELVCWALVESKGEGRIVVGIDGGDYTDFADEQSNFLGYSAPGEGADKWAEDARKHQQRQAATKPAVIDEQGARPA